MHLNVNASTPNTRALVYPCYGSLVQCWNGQCPYDAFGCPHVPECGPGMSSDIPNSFCTDSIGIVRCENGLCAGCALAAPSSCPAGEYACHVAGCSAEWCERIPTYLSPSSLGWLPNVIQSIIPWMPKWVSGVPRRSLRRDCARVSRHGTAYLSANGCLALTSSSSLSRFLCYLIRLAIKESTDVLTEHVEYRF